MKQYYRMRFTGQLVKLRVIDNLFVIFRHVFFPKSQLGCESVLIGFFTVPMIETFLKIYFPQADCSFEQAVNTI